MRGMTKNRWNEEKIVQFAINKVENNDKCDMERKCHVRIDKYTTRKKGKKMKKGGKGRMRNV